MQTFQYVDRQGQLKTIQASSADQALANVRSINPQSGVMAVQQPATPTQPPAQPPVQPPVQPQAQPTTQNRPIISDIYNESGLDRAITQGVNYYGNMFNTTPKTEQEIFEDKRRLYQAEIDAINKIYADKIQTARVAGQNRLGSSTAVQARSGLLGSDFGLAQTDKVIEQNREVENDYLNEQSVKIAELLGRARSEAVAEAEAKRRAREEGATKYIEFLTAQESRKNSRVTNLAKSLIAQGIDIRNMSESEISSLASSYGVDRNTIISAYNSEKLANDKALAELQKNQPDTSFTLSQGQERFVLDPKTGNYVKVASTAKTFAPRGQTSATGTSSTSSEIYGSDLDALIGTALSGITSKFGQQTFQNQIARARNDGDKLNLVASQVLRGAPSEIRNDFSNQAIAMKQLDKAINELDAGVKSGFLNSKAQYVAGVFGRDFDPKLQKVQALITSAIQPYRASVTGAAWGTQEDAEYADLFGSIKYSPAELRNRLVNMKETLKSKSATALNTFVNPLGTYGNQFEIGQFTPTTSNNQVDNVLSEFGL